MNRHSHQTPTQHGFTLIELMIVVVIVAVLTVVALVAYQRHLMASRVVEAKSFMAAIQARQEAYNQRFGQYCHASEDTATYYPTLGNGHCPGGGSDEPCAKPWNPPSYAPPAGWTQLGAQPETLHTYFEWLVVASDPTQDHAFGGDSNPSALGIPAQPAGGSPHSWYYIIARADLDGSGVPCSATNCTTLTATSARAEIIELNEGQ